MKIHKFTGFILVALTIFLGPTSVTQAFDDYPPVNMQIWPSVEYVLEVSTSVSEDEAIHRQYYGKHIVRLDTIAEEGHFSVIYRFTEDGVGETVLFVEDQEYFTHILSHDDFLEMNDSFEALLYPTLPGEELSMPGMEKTGEREFLGRQVEEWSFTDYEDGRAVVITLLIDRELRQIMKLTVDGEVGYLVTKVEVGALSPETFNPPVGYEPFGQ